ncbi:hypothetical protein OIDMADRAFT_48999 [Oidiodendron maius Zn]|uniref:Transcription factor domain-containing protein n=1 Tax=Oidiodendron maius (strain Zn) TaxID=913774 RepID=A0A0C3DTR5_OIDMZ|nr:hypothetical protein OIDMADRAFT_48999 [Oidiodendron maius Zn]
MCVEAAQQVTSPIIETLEPDELIGLLPWWYRVYYLHIAGTNFLAAMFGPNLFTESVSQSWHNAMSALRTHEHLSTYIQQCIRTFETLLMRIMETRYPNSDGSGEAAIEEGTSYFFGDIFQDVGFDFDIYIYIFGTEDIISDQL